MFTSSSGKRWLPSTTTLSSLSRRAYRIRRGPFYSLDHCKDDIGTRAECWIAHSVEGETDGDEKAAHDPVRNRQRSAPSAPPTSRTDKTWVEFPDLLDCATGWRIHKHLVPNPEQ